MNALKCPTCGVVNFATAETCVKCKGNFEEMTAIASHVTAPMIAMPAASMPMRAITCPYCQSTIGTEARGKTSTGGWILFVILLLICFILSPLAFMVQDYEYFCLGCGMKLA